MFLQTKWLIWSNPDVELDLSISQDTLTNLGLGARQSTSDTHSGPRDIFPSQDKDPLPAHLAWH